MMRLPTANVKRNILYVGFTVVAKPNRLWFNCTLSHKPTRIVQIESGYIESGSHVALRKSHDKYGFTYTHIALILTHYAYQWHPRCALPDD